MDGWFEGIIYKYNNVKFSNRKCDGELALKFTYDIMNPNKNIKSKTLETILVIY